MLRNHAIIFDVCPFSSQHVCFLYISGGGGATFQVLRVPAIPNTTPNGVCGQVFSEQKWLKCDAGAQK